MCVRKRRDLLLRTLAVLVIFGLCFLLDRRMRPAFGPERFGAEQVVILDAGHGGEDGGAVSVRGAKESRINLEIVQRMEQVFVFLGTSPILTREDDRSLHDPEAETLREKKVSDLKNRAALFQSYGDVPAVSIHQNTYPEGRYRGCQVFYAPTEGSKELAELVQADIKNHLQPENSREAKAIPENVYLMNHIPNPAILVECGFLTNPEEESLLQTPAYQKQLAMIVCSAVTKAEG